MGDMKIKIRSDLLRLAHVHMVPPGASQHQFSDVPADHWAAKSVLDLRKAGILIGYPGESFRG